MLADAEKLMSTAPLMVPAARYGASGASAVSAARCALLMHAIAGETAQIWARPRSRARPGQGRCVARRNCKGDLEGGREEERWWWCGGRGLGTRVESGCGSDRVDEVGFAFALRAGTRDLAAFGRVIPSDHRCWFHRMGRCVPLDLKMHPRLCAIQVNPVSEQV